jgi:hypothetical protein
MSARGSILERTASERRGCKGGTPRFPPSHGPTEASLRILMGCPARVDRRYTRRCRSRLRSRTRGRFRGRAAP